MDEVEEAEKASTKGSSDTCFAPEKVRLVASTEPRDAKQEVGGYFETVQWTADGTTVLTTSSSNTASGYVVPEDLLRPHERPLSLSPQSTISLPEPTNVLAPAPYFQIAEPYTNQLLVSCRDHPIQLFYLYPPALPQEEDDDDDNANGQAAAPRHAPLSSYPFVKARSETFLTATALVWPAPGSHFVAGCRNLLARFDVTRTGAPPLLRIKTIPSERHLSKGGGVGMRGTVSALAAQPPDAHTAAGLVAAGTWTRCVGLYDFGQAGECASTWSVEAAARGAGDTHGRGIGGDGIMQTVWSPCGRYLLVSERKSRGVLVYDVRVTGQLLGWLEGREALTNQRVHCDVFPGQQDSAGFEVWSGSTDGTVKLWEGVGSRAGAHAPSWAWKGHGSAVGSTCLHPSGSVVASCSGSWAFPNDGEAGAGSELSTASETGTRTETLNWMRRKNQESSLKLWSLESPKEDA